MPTSNVVRLYLGQMHRAVMRYENVFNMVSFRWKSLRRKKKEKLAGVGEGGCQINEKTVSLSFCVAFFKNVSLLAAFLISAVKRCHNGITD